jgi:hypothetical protein
LCVNNYFNMDVSCLYYLNAKNTEFLSRKEKLLSFSLCALCDYSMIGLMTYLTQRSLRLIFIFSYYSVVLNRISSDELPT